MAVNASSQPDRPITALVETADGHGPLMACGARTTPGCKLAPSWVFYRIDDHLATPAIAAKARREQIYLDQRFSDHAPLTIDYDFKL